MALTFIIFFSQYALALAGAGGRFARFAEAALYDCAAGEKPLGAHVGLYQAATAVANPTDAAADSDGGGAGPAGAALALWQVRLALAHQNSRALNPDVMGGDEDINGEGDAAALVRPSLLHSLHEAVMAALREWALRPETLRAFLRGGKSPAAALGGHACAAAFGAAAAYVGLPPHAEELRGALEAARCMAQSQQAPIVPLLAALLPGTTVEVLQALAMANSDD